MNKKLFIFSVLSVFSMITSIPCFAANPQIGGAAGGDGWTDIAMIAAIGTGFYVCYEARKYVDDCEEKRSKQQIEGYTTGENAIAVVAVLGLGLVVALGTEG